MEMILSQVFNFMSIPEQTTENQNSYDLSKFSDRLMSAVVEAGLPTAQRPLGNALGVSPTTVYFWQRNEKPPSSKRLRMIAEILGVKEEWLGLGRGARYVETSDVSPDTNLFARDFDKLTESQKKVVRTLVDEFLETQKQRRVQES